MEKRQDQKGKRGKRVKFIILGVIFGSIALCLIVYGCFCGKGGSYYNEDGSYKHIEETNSYRYAMDHPALDGFGKWVLPWHDNLLATVTAPLRINYLMPMLVPADMHSVLDGYNFVIDQANEGNGGVSYSYYSEDDIAADPSKASTGLMLLRGEEGAPFAMVVAGGGFTAVEINHEGFPVAKKLHDHGYNVFILRYRVKGDYKDPEGVNVPENAAADGIAAYRWILNHADELGVSTKSSSVWGFSAGGYVVNSVANSDQVTTPAALIMGYPALSGAYSADTPDTFIAMCKDDPLIASSNVEQRVQQLRDLGVQVEYDSYPVGGHGFGSGNGTPQEGWMEKAIQFWEEAQE